MVCGSSGCFRFGMSFIPQIGHSPGLSLMTCGLHSAGVRASGWESLADGFPAGKINPRYRELAARSQQDYNDDAVYVSFGFSVALDFNFRVDLRSRRVLNGVESETDNCFEFSQ
jgi:hypothetical protein